MLSPNQVGIASGLFCQILNLIALFSCFWTGFVCGRMYLDHGCGFYFLG